MGVQHPDRHGTRQFSDAHVPAHCTVHIHEFIVKKVKDTKSRKWGNGEERDNGEGGIAPGPTRPKFHENHTHLFDLSC